MAAVQRESEEGVGYPIRCQGGCAEAVGTSPDEQLASTLWTDEETHSGPRWENEQREEEVGFLAR